MLVKFTLKSNTVIRSETTSPHNTSTLVIVFVLPLSYKTRKRKSFRFLFLASDYTYLHLNSGIELSMVNCRRLVGESLRYGPDGIWSCPAAASKQGSSSLTPLVYDYVRKLFINRPTRWLQCKAHAVKTFSRTC